jgi:hypothetical protein
MAGYAVSSRLHGAVPRLAGAGARQEAANAADDILRAAVASGGWWVAAPGMPSELTAPEPLRAERIELIGRPIDAAVRDWLASIGETWSQVTFYLFDPQSWR